MVDKFFENNYFIKIKRTNRKKTISIKVLDGFVQINSPKDISDEDISNLIKKKNNWITKNLKEYKEKLKSKKFVNDEIFFLLGSNYKLKIIKDTDKRVKINKSFLEVYLPEVYLIDEIRNLICKWYIKKATDYLNRRTNDFAKIMDVNPNSIIIKNYKSRWGTCYPDGKISYNWKIIMAPDHVVDYLIVHELCHLIHPNHSSSFWNSVKEILPKYNEYRTWLKKNEQVFVI